MFGKELNCKYCKKEPKYWDGDNIKCWNVEKEDNWNCQMLNKIRNLSQINDNRINYTYFEDQNYLIINGLDEILDDDIFSLYCT